MLFHWAPRWGNLEGSGTQHHALEVPLPGGETPSRTLGGLKGPGPRVVKALRVVGLVQELACP